MTQTDKILSRKEGGVGYLTFNNPARHNAMSLDMWEKAGQVMNDFATDDSIRVVILSGAGGKAFVSGADISEFETARSTPEQVKRYDEIGEYFTAEQPTWNSAAVVLAANALGGDGPTAGLFRGEGLPAGLTAQELIDAGAAIEANRSTHEQH